MMNKKNLGILLLVAGVVLLIASLAADVVGLGQAAVFGYKQIAGAIVGVIVAAVGYFMAFRK